MDRPGGGGGVWFGRGRFSDSGNRLIRRVCLIGLLDSSAWWSTPLAHCASPRVKGGGFVTGLGFVMGLVKAIISTGEEGAILLLLLLVISLLGGVSYGVK